MDPKIIEMRRMMAERYKSACIEDKPQDRMCPDCEKSVYSSKICSITGRLHELHIPGRKVLGGKIVDTSKKSMDGKELIQAIDGVRVKWQAARTALVEIDNDAASIFQTFVMQRQWKLQRYGIMYGKYNEKENKIVVHSVYEPEQQGSETSFEPLSDAREERVDRLAKMLGLRRVGLIITHPPRNVNEIVLSGKELMMLAREQSRFGDECVLLAVSPNPETMQINAHAWQASQQCVHLYQIGLLFEHPADIRFCQSREPLELAQEDTDQKGHKKCIIKEPSHAVDTRWMTGPTAVGSITSDVIGSRFVRISRPGEAPPDFSNVKNFFEDPKRKHRPFVEKIADFHILIYLMESLFDINSDMPLICQSILAKDAQGVSVYEDLINAHMQAS